MTTGSGLSGIDPEIMEMDAELLLTCIGLRDVRNSSTFQS